MKWMLPLCLLSCLSVACDHQDDSSLSEAWNPQNDPKILDMSQMGARQGYTTDFSRLPLNVSLSVEPWSGDYWATFRGGISLRWNVGEGSVYDMADKEVEPLYAYDILAGKEALSSVDIASLSPAEKYDIYTGAYDFTLTRYERSRTRVMQTVASDPAYNPEFEIPRWEGLCHAWAPATIQYKAPKPVTLTNADGIEIPFGASDIKALLTYNLHVNETGAETKILGLRCELDVEDLKEQFNAGDLSFSEYRQQYRQRLASSPCADTNAGAFHVVLANQIGLLDEGFVVDITRDSEVWNQSVSAFSSDILERKAGARAKSAEGTVETVLVRTKMTYTNEVDFSWTGELKSYDNPRGEKIYYYYLELDAQGQIIGGEWANVEDVDPDADFEDLDEKDDRPDFLWKMSPGDFVGFFGPLREIYEASVK